MTTDIDPRKAQRAQAYFETGLEAAKRRNLEYALQMIGDACKLMPTHLAYRQGLRATQRMKYENDPGKVGMMARARAQTIRAQIRLSKSSGSWLKVLEGCEDAFQLNPWDIGTAMDAAEAALELGVPELAEWNLSSVADEAEEHLDYLRLRSRVYESLGKFEAAIRCIELVREKAPADQDITSKLNELSAKAMMARSGLGSAARGASAAAGVEPRSRAGSEVRVEPESDDSDSQAAALASSKLSPEDRLKRRLEESPDDSRAAVELADIHKAADRWDEADRVLRIALQHAPEDAVLRQIHAETRLGRMARALENWDNHLSEQPDDAEARAKRAELLKKRDEFEIGELRRRIAANPSDAESQFRLGTALARVERWDEAIAAFQQARNDVAWKVRALTEAGVCFERIGSAKLAERSFSDALKNLAPDQTAMFNDLHYRLGTLAERLGKLQEAEDHYNEVAANDFGYKDVAKRLRDIQTKM